MGRNIKVFIDHKPFVDVISKTSDPWAVRQQRQLAFISEFTTDIMHIAGKNNVVVDWLSKQVIDNVSFGIDYTAMPLDMSSDRGSQFTSAIWSHIAKLHMFQMIYCQQNMCPAERHSNAHMMVHTKLLPQDRKHFVSEWKRKRDIHRSP